MLVSKRPLEYLLRRVQRGGQHHRVSHKPPTIYGHSEPTRNFLDTFDG